MRSLEPHLIVERGSLRGCPLLSLEAEDDPAEMYQSIVHGLAPNTQAVRLRGPRSWDGDYMSEVARRMAGGRLTQDTEFIVERGIFTTAGWPYASESCYITLDCSILFSTYDSLTDLQRALREDVGLLPDIEEVLVTLREPTTAKHLDALAVEFPSADLWVDGLLPATLSNIICKCTMPWRVG